MTFKSGAPGLAASGLVLAWAASAQDGASVPVSASLVPVWALAILAQDGDLVPVSASLAQVLASVPVWGLAVWVPCGKFSVSNNPK